MLRLFVFLRHFCHRTIVLFNSKQGIFFALYLLISFLLYERCLTTNASLLGARKVTADTWVLAESQDLATKSEVFESAKDTVTRRNAGVATSSHMSSGNARVLSLERDDPGVKSVHSEWLDDVTRTLPRGKDLWRGNLIKEQATMYLRLVRSPWLSISTVCETGFFKGVSTHLWLFAKPGLKVHSFDINFDKVALAKLMRRFDGPPRLFTYQGDSNETIPRMPRETICDLISVDGSHEGWQPLHDLMLLARHGRCINKLFAPTYVVFDDTFELPQMSQNRDPASLVVNNNPGSKEWLNWCTRSYWYAVSIGLLEHEKCTKFNHIDGRFPKGFCMAKLRSNCVYAM